MQGFAINRMGGLGSGKWSPNRVFAGDAGFYGDPAMFGTMNTIWDGSGVAPTAAGDLIGLVNRIAGTFNLDQSVSGNRPPLATFPKSGFRQLFTYPRAINNAAWTKASCTITDGVTSYDGTATASLLLSTTSGTSGVLQNPTTASVQKTHSYILKAGTGTTWVRLFGPAAANQNAWINLLTGAVGTVQASITVATPVSLGNGWWLCAATGTGTANIGLRLANADNSNTANLNQELYVADPQLELGGVRTTWQNNINNVNVTETGQPQIWLPRGNGTSSGLNGPVGFGLCPDGIFADTGVNAKLPFVFRTLADGTIAGQRGAVDANAMFQLYVSSGTLRTRFRGTETNTGWVVNLGAVHCGSVDLVNGVPTISMDSQTPIVCSVGAAAKEATELTFGYYNKASPAGWLTGHFWCSVIDKDLSASNDAQWLAYNCARYQP